MRKIFAVSVLAVFLLSGCAEVDSGTIKDKYQEAGTSEYDCDNKTTGTGKHKKTTRVCGFERNPDICRFHLDNGKEKGWLEVDCATIFREYEIGEDYPR